MAAIDPESSSASAEDDAGPREQKGGLIRLLRGLGRRGERAGPKRCIADIAGFGYGEAEGAAQDASLSSDFPPSFFIVGAPRCGTTALSKVLARNPRISFSKPKETHIFAEPRPGFSEADLGTLYLRRYHLDLCAEHQAVGDGSVSYLYVPEAIQRALNFDPRSKFIVMVRNPLDMLRSYHARMLFQLDEDVEDFGIAWALQQSRAAGRNIPKRCRDARLLQYADLGKLGAHLERLLEVAGRDRVLVLVFDDWVQNPREVYLQVLEFIGVDDDAQTNFSAKRETAGFKSHWLQQFVMNPPPWALRVVEVSNVRTLKRLKHLRRRIKEINTHPQQRKTLSEEMRQTLRDYFAEDVKKLSGLISRDLSHWC
jgi:hypothetical protein